MKKIVIAFVILAMMITLAPAAFAADEGQADVPEVPAAGKCMMKYAKKYIGSSYVLGGKHLKNLKKKHDRNRVDCIGFLRGIMKKYARIKISGGSYNRVKRSCIKKGGRLIGYGKKALRKAKPGDILIYKPELGRGQHFGFYYGKKRGVHYQIDSSPRGHGINITNVCRKRVYVVRMEKQIASKSKKYKNTVDDILEESMKEEEQQQ